MRAVFITFQLYTLFMITTCGDKVKKSQATGAVYGSNSETKTGSNSTTTESTSILPNINLPEVFKTVAADAQSLGSAERTKVRYFTLHVVANGRPDTAVLATQRAAFKKTINSLSNRPTIVEPKSLEPGERLYRVNLDDIGMTTRVFDRIVRDFYPFTLSLPDSEVPVIRIDWFNASATLPELYRRFLNLPNNLSAFESQILGPAVDNVDKRITNIVNNDILRTGFDNSNVSFSNRIVERHALAKGSYWISYDFFNLKVGDRFTDSNGRTKTARLADITEHNINRSPLGPIGTNTDRVEFLHDGGEIIYSLPNGLFGYYLVNAKGTLLDKGPTNVVRQNAGPAEFASAITNGMSCMSCHQFGLLKQADTIVNTIARDNSHLTAEDKERFAAIFKPAEINQIMDRENKAYFAAMTQMGIDLKSPDPIEQTFRFYNRPLNKKDVMNELEVTTEQIDQIAGDADFAGIFNPLLSPNGTVSRGTFQAIFPAVIKKYRDGVRYTRPASADFVVTVDCMIADLLQMDRCTVSPINFNAESP